MSIDFFLPTNHHEGHFDHDHSQRVVAKMSERLVELALLNQQRVLNEHEYKVYQHVFDGLEARGIKPRDVLVEAGVVGTSSV